MLKVIVLLRSLTVLIPDFDVIDLLGGLLSGDQFLRRVGLEPEDRLRLLARRRHKFVLKVLLKDGVVSFDVLVVHFSNK